MIEPLLDWWRSHLDGEWEHHNGFTIETADNPGLVVSLIPGRPLGLDRIVEQTDAYDIRVRDGKLIGFAPPGSEACLISRLVILVEILPNAE